MGFWSKLAEAWTPDLDDTVHGNRGEADGDYVDIHSGHDLLVRVEVPVGQAAITVQKRLGQSGAPAPAAEEPVLSSGQRVLESNLGRIDKLRGDTLVVHAVVERGTATHELAALCLSLAQHQPDSAQGSAEGQQSYSVESRWNGAGVAELTIAVHVG